MHTEPGRYGKNSHAIPCMCVQTGIFLPLGDTFKLDMMWLTKKEKHMRWRRYVKQGHCWKSYSTQTVQTNLVFPAVQN